MVPWLWRHVVKSSRRIVGNYLGTAESKTVGQPFSWCYEMKYDLDTALPLRSRGRGAWEQMGSRAVLWTDFQAHSVTDPC